MIVQTDSEAAQHGLAAFDPSLGQLNSVTLTVDVLIKYRDFLLFVPSDVPLTRDVTWSIDGLYEVWGSGLSSYSLPPTQFAISGSGTTSVILDQFSLGRAFGFFTTTASGSATYSLNPADFILDPLNPFSFIFTGDDVGYYNPIDTLFTVAGPHSIIHLSGSCNGVQTGDDFCGGVRYSLAYDYTPAGSVPEPASWAMILLGFGAAGVALRRRQRRRIVSPTLLPN
ncbi:PEPxxWA-CTERM sorting domain-containing protein [Sphingomonas daechungensis]|uniref:PEPxxWA-CTERM sorting domain-containing protein n=1 Tax=Sphingomonas daechungensis TaxID=1176646 RepID=UPI003782DE39